MPSERGCSSRYLKMSHPELSRPVRSSTGTQRLNSAHVDHVIPRATQGNSSVSYGRERIHPLPHLRQCSSSTQLGNHHTGTLPSSTSSKMQRSNTHVIYAQHSPPLTPTHPQDSMTHMYPPGMRPFPSSFPLTSALLPNSMRYSLPPTVHRFGHFAANPLIPTFLPFYHRNLVPLPGCVPLHSTSSRGQQFPPPVQRSSTDSYCRLHSGRGRENIYQAKHSTVCPVPMSPPVPTPPLTHQDIATPPGAAGSSAPHFGKQERTDRQPQSTQNNIDKVPVEKEAAHLPAVTGSPLMNNTVPHPVNDVKSVLEVKDLTAPSPPAPEVQPIVLENSSKILPETTAAVAVPAEAKSATDCKEEAAELLKGGTEIMNHSNEIETTNTNTSPSKALNVPRQALKMTSETAVHILGDSEARQPKKANKISPPKRNTSIKKEYIDFSLDSSQAISELRSERSGFNTERQLDLRSSLPSIGPEDSLSQLGCRSSFMGGAPPRRTSIDPHAYGYHQARTNDLFNRSTAKWSSGDNLHVGSSDRYDNVSKLSSKKSTNMSSSYKEANGSSLRRDDTSLVASRNSAVTTFSSYSSLTSAKKETIGRSHHSNKSKVPRLPILPEGSSETYAPPKSWDVGKLNRMPNLNSHRSVMTGCSVRSSATSIWGMASREDVDVVLLCVTAQSAAVRLQRAFRHRQKVKKIHKSVRNIHRLFCAIYKLQYMWRRWLRRLTRGRLAPVEETAHQEAAKYIDLLSCGGADNESKVDLPTQTKNVAKPLNPQPLAQRVISQLDKNKISPYLQETQNLGSKSSVLPEIPAGRAEGLSRVASLRQDIEMHNTSSNLADKKYIDQTSHDLRPKGIPQDEQVIPVIAKQLRGEREIINGSNFWEEATELSPSINKIPPVNPHRFLKRKTPPLDAKNIKKVDVSQIKSKVAEELTSTFIRTGTKLTPVGQNRSRTSLKPKLQNTPPQARKSTMVTMSSQRKPQYDDRQPVGAQDVMQYPRVSAEHTDTGSYSYQRFYRKKASS